MLRRGELRRFDGIPAVLVLVLSVAAVCSLAGEPQAEKPPTEATAVPLGAAARVDWGSIFRNLPSSDAVVRETAVNDFMLALEEFSKITKKPYFAKLKTDLASKDAAVHDPAAKRVVVIGQILQGDKKNFPVLLKELASAEAEIRNKRLEGIFKYTEESLQSDHVRDLIDKLGEENADETAKAFAELKAMGGEAADEIASGLDDEKTQVKKMCAELLKEMGPGAKDAVTTLLFKIQDAEDKLGRKLAAQALENLGPDAAEGVDDLVMNLTDDDKVLRRISANIFKKVGTAGKSAADDLVSNLTHEEKSVRNISTELLLALGVEAKAGLKSLIETIDEPADPKNPNAEPANDIDSKIRAANVLASIGADAKEALPNLKKFENHNDPDLKDAIKKAIEKINAEKPADIKPPVAPAVPSETRTPVAPGEVNPPGKQPEATK